MLWLLDAIWQSLSAGGWILIPIFLVGTLGFYLLLMSYLELGSDLYGDQSDLTQIRSWLENREYDKAINHLQGKKGLISFSILTALKNRHLPEKKLRNLLDEKLYFRVSEMDRRLPLIVVMASAAPLLGLLGTVTGMVHTFQVITIWGSGNPLLMAGGISEALITTQSGLLMAFPLILLERRLRGRINFIKGRMEFGVTMAFNSFYNTNSRQGDGYGTI